MCSKKKPIHSLGPNGDLDEHYATNTPDLGISAHPLLSLISNEWGICQILLQWYQGRCYKEEEEKDPLRRHANKCEYTFIENMQMWDIQL